MSTKYKATMRDTGYFVTIAIVGCCGHGLQIRAIGLIYDDTYRSALVKN
jgi:hypothetical protein